jgi:hypothetical protein
LSTEELSGVGPDGDEGVSGANAWQAWEQAGIDPGAYNPYEVRQYTDWVGELTNAETHESALESAMRQWGHLGDDESLQDLIQYRDQLRQQRNDPFAQYQQEGYDEYDPYEYQHQQGIPEHNLIDPNELREVWRQDMQAQLAQEREQMNQQMQTERLVQDLQGQLESVSSSQGLDEDEKAFLWEAATTRLVNQQVDLQDVPRLMENTWSQIDSLYQKRVARSARSQSGQPRTSVPAAGTPSDSPSGRGLSQALAKTAEALGIPQE